MQGDVLHPPVVLIVELDQNVRALQTFFMERAGYSVVFAGDGQTALHQASTLLPALIITEILVPQLDGLALCRRIREDGRTRDIPVLVFSILAAASRVTEAGANAFLRKPFVETLFLATVQSLIAAQSTEMVEDRWASQ